MEILSLSHVFPVRLARKGDYEDYTTYTILFLDQINKKVYNRDGGEVTEEMATAVLNAVTKPTTVTIPSQVKDAMAKYMEKQAIVKQEELKHAGIV